MTFNWYLEPYTTNLVLLKNNEIRDLGAFFSGIPSDTMFQALMSPIQRQLRALRVTPNHRYKVIGPNEPSPMRTKDQKLDLLLKSYSNLTYNWFLGP